MPNSSCADLLKPFYYVIKDRAGADRNMKAANHILDIP